LKYVPIVITALLLASGVAWSDDYIRLGADTIPANSHGYDLVFYIERMCPIPEFAMGASNGFTITATGTATWSFTGSQQDYFYQDASSFVVWNLGGLIYSPVDMDGFSPDRFLTGGAAMPPGGMPIIMDEPYFHLILDIGSGQGEICIDSAFIPPAGSWKFSQMTCGQGGEPNRPLFVDKYGNDDDHPICITVCDPPCGGVDAADDLDISYVTHPTALHQNYPNPFNPSTTIEFYLDRTADVELHIFNVIGQRVRLLDLGQLGRGPHSTVWDGKDDASNLLPSGLYFYRMEAGNQTQLKKMILLK
jgi:hypothetical protein